MMVVASFVFFLAVFVVIGGLSALQSRGSNADYLLAGSSVKPWLVSLSAVATNNSGYMFIGLIGYTYTSGLQSAWLMIGFILGDFLISFLTHKRLRKATDRTGALSFGGILSTWNGTDFRLLRIVSGLATLAFLGTYAAAQLNAGSKALHVLLGWNYETGAIIGAVIVVIYCLAGGIRASIWTDAAQSFVMLASMLLMFVLAVNQVGGWEIFQAHLYAVSETYMNWFPDNLAYGPFLFVMGWMFAGVGVVGQPHVMVRFMAMEDPAHMTRIRWYYYSWYTIFAALCIGVGLATRLLLPLDTGFDTELALPTLAQNILPPVLVGLTLAGLFAATMSTADSQILSCTAAISQDFTHGRDIPYWATKLSTLAVTLLALTIALFGSNSVFALVLIAWSALSSIFAPLLIVYALGQKPNATLALTMMIAGLSTVLIWRHYGLSGDIYEVLPGILSGLIVFALGKALGFTLKDVT